MLVEKRINKFLRYAVFATVFVMVFASVTITGLGGYYIFRAQRVNRTPLVAPSLTTTNPPPPTATTETLTAETLIAKAQQLLSANQPSEAITLLDRAITLNNSLPEAYRLRATAAIALNDFPTAINNYQQTLQRNNQDVDSYERLGKLLEQLGRDPEAIENYSTALQQHPNEHNLRLRLATALLRTGDLEAARKQYEQLAEAAAPELAALARKELKRFATTTTASIPVKPTSKTPLRPETPVVTNSTPPPVAHSSPPRDPDPLPPPKVETPKLPPRVETAYSSADLIQRGNQLNNGGDLRGALREYEKALKQDPSNADIHYLMGTVYFKLRDFESARNAYQKCTSGVYASVARNALKNVEKELKKR
jgi:tetratricopeptide (TPR) repeat protein